MENKKLSLRQRAEEFLNKQPETVKESASVDLKRLVEDLHIHQTELEIQNEELRRAQLELELSRDRYFDLYDFAPVGYVTISEQGIILQANLYCAEMLGVERGSFVGKPLSRFITKDDQDVFYFHRKKLLETKTKQVCELKLARKDRSRLYAQLQSIIVKDTSGDIGQIRTMIIDISDRKQIEKELLTLNERLGLAQNEAKVGIWDWDMDSGNIYWSSQMFTLFGLDPLKTTASFEAWRSVLHPDDLEIAEQLIDLALKERSFHNSDYRIILPSGEIRWINAAGKGVYDEQGRPTRMIGICLDITDRKLAEEALQVKEEQLRIAVEGGQLGTWTWNLTNNEVNWNAFLYELLGRDPNGPAITGKTFFTYIHPDDIERVRRHVDETLRKGTDFFDEFRVVREDKEIRWLAASGRIYRDKNGQPIQIAGVNYDITDKKQFEETIQKAHNSLEEKVKERTAELEEANEELKREIEERKKAEEETRVAKERYALAVAGSSDTIWDWDILSDIVYYSGRFKEVMGYDLGETPKTLHFFRSRLHPEDVDAVSTAIDRHLKERVPYNIEYRMKSRSGEYRWFLARGQAIWDGKGNAIRMAGSLHDITERIETMTNLRDALVEIKSLKGRLEAEKAYLQEEIKSEYNHENIIGNSNTLRYTLHKVEQIAPTDTAVLILGETGTGKELISRAIHDSGPRRHRAFVKVNCATLPSNLMESELFGHEKGAFSGAVAKRLGRFEVADGATLFLDEIGELSLDLQTKLLRVLEDGEFERVGSSQTVKVDVRVIAATNRDLEAEVRSGRFRQDLWFRLNVFPITMPPLRSRKEDIPMLVEFFVGKVSKRLGKSIDVITKSVMDTLQNYHWPGNIRELQNVIERAVINASENKLRLMDELEPSKKDVPKILKTMEKVEYEHIVRVLKETRWKVAGKNGAAEILGLNPSTLHGRMRKLGIRKPKRSNS